MSRDRDTIYGTVRDPQVLWHGSVPASPFKNVADDYDRAARILLSRAEDWAKRHGRKLALERKFAGLVVTRVFQAPCPVSVSRSADRRRRGRHERRGK